MEIKINVDELRKVKLFVATPCYGGMAHGLYMKSILDLQNTMNKYGIEVKFSFLFNESLVQRARNYCSDEFIRSGFTHMMFIDSDIHFNAQDVLAMLALDKELVVGSYPKKCCPANASIETEDGVKNIKWIVDNKYTGKVKSFNGSDIVWKNVISHSVEPKDNNKVWVRIGNGGQKKLVVTDDHECAVVDDILYPTKVLYKEAKDLRNEYIIKDTLVLEQSRGNISNPLYSPDQMDFLIGTLFGDGSIRKGYLGFGHSLKQQEYLELKQQIFGGKIGQVKKVGEYKGKEYFAQFLDCPRNAQISHLENLLYTNDGGKCKKTIDKVLPYLNEKGLAFFYLDDGSLAYQSNGKPSITLHINSFTKDDCEKLGEHLLNKWGIVTSLTFSGNGFQPRLRILQKSADTFFKIIAKYVIPEMEYKIPEEYRTQEKYDFSSLKSLKYSAQFVKNITVLNTKNSHTPRKLYDIGVDGTSCFFSNTFLVHNCINWKNIIEAVKRNPEIKPNDLEQLVGEYVFNPVAGTQSFNVTEPIEVMDAGTGFMLIKREVFDKFKEAYPQLAYKPDHVGQEHFDGSRYIHAYFDTLIDTEDSLLGNGSERFLSEDYLYTQLYRKIGGKVWMCPWVKLGHCGTYEFKGNLPHVAQFVGKL